MAPSGATARPGHAGGGPLPFPLLPLASALTARCMRAHRGLPAGDFDRARVPALGRRVVWKLWVCMLGEDDFFREDLGMMHELLARVSSLGASSQDSGGSCKTRSLRPRHFQIKFKSRIIGKCERFHKAKRSRLLASRLIISVRPYLVLSTVSEFAG